jgi:hypothetical protein
MGRQWTPTQWFRLGAGAQRRLSSEHTKLFWEEGPLWMLQVEVGFREDMQRGKSLENSGSEPHSLLLIPLPFQLFFQLLDSVLQLDFGLLGSFQLSFKHLLLP